MIWQSVILFNEPSAVVCYCRRNVGKMQTHVVLIIAYSLRLPMLVV